jgi:hypothetical protein
MMARILSVDTDILDEIVYGLYQEYTLWDWAKKKGEVLASPIIFLN